MPHCTAEPVQWKHREAFRLSNGTLEITILLGGGHLADLRLCGSPINALFEAPWPTIEPQTFSSSEHAALYGESAVGKLLSGYTGHAVALGYFGMPSESQPNLPLHGEAVAAEWQVASSNADDRIASAVFMVELPASNLHFSRRITLAADSHVAMIEESLRNLSDAPQDFQWVEHAAFGPPLLDRGDSRLYLSANRGITWHLGYEGHEILPNNLEFAWPNIASSTGEPLDLSSPFVRSKTGFVASLLADMTLDHAFIAVHNRRLQLLAGYVYRPQDFPWIALWEENRARTYAPWNGMTQVRGVEFGNTPLPLGLDHARQNPRLFETPTYEQLRAGEQAAKSYFAYLCPAPPDLHCIEDVNINGTQLVIR